MLLPSSSKDRWEAIGGKMKNPQNMQDLFKNSREIWLEGARLIAFKMLKKRRLITIEDVLEAHPRPKFLHRNTTGSVFKSDMFKPIGFTLAKKPSSHKRVIRLWTLKEEYRNGRHPYRWTKSSSKKSS